MSLKLKTTYTYYDILGVFAIWFIFGFVTLLSIDLLYTVGIENLLTLLGIDIQHALDLPLKGKYLLLALKL